MADPIREVESHMGQTVEYSVDAGLATLRLARAHGNAINGELADDTTEAIRRAEQDPEVRGVLLAARGKLFCPGLDLQELIELDREAVSDFLDRFSECILALYAFPKPVVAAVHGHAVAGGCVLTLTADWRVLAEGAMTGLNEVRVGVTFPYGVAMILRESTPSPKVEEVALYGRNYSGDDAMAAGLAHELRPAEGFEGHCRARLAELADKPGRAFALTKRYLRSAVVERIRAHDAALRHEFLDSWFDPPTRARMQRIVTELQGRDG
jgi:enoyl-CoA hydratase